MKYISTILAFILLMTFAACQSGNKSVDKIDSEEYRDLLNEIDRITADFSTGEDNLSLPHSEEFMNADDEKKAELAIDLADDMAQAQLFGIVNSSMLALSGEAVKAYPHPLLLNNYGALLLDTGNIEDSLYFFQKAEVQNAENPVLLTNIANAFLDLEDFSSAENYANRALAAASDFGAAYQVLTTVYMQKEQYKTAAQYLLKSAKHCFNDISEYQFESFLDAVEELDPEEDDYPLDEQDIEEFRKAAIENVDTKDINDSVDTPSAQLKLKPFPQIGSPDNLMRSFDYLREECDKFQEKYFTASQEIMRLGNKSYTESSGENSRGELVYRVEKNLRQIYAYKVLQSYYEHKQEQIKRRCLKKLREIEKRKYDDIEQIEEKYEGKREVMQDDSLSSDQLLAELFSVFDTQKLPEISKYTAAVVAAQMTVVDERTEILRRSKECSSEIVNQLEEYYNEAGQILEEFWLKAGGILKCFADKDTFRMYDMQRQQLVYSYAGLPVNELADQASVLEREDFELRMEKMTLESLIAANEQAEEADEAAKAKYRAGETVPDMEEEAISEYNEKNELGAIGAEVDAFGFSGEVQYGSDYEGDKISLSASAPLGSVGGEYTLGSGNKNAYAVHGVDAGVKTDRFKDTKTLNEALGKPGKVGRAIGHIRFGYSQSSMSGKYVQTGSNNHITDRGVVRVRTTSGSIGPITKTTKVVVKKSLMTGVATKKTTTKYKFIFFTYEK
jgi:hypothetical protein